MLLIFTLVIGINKDLSFYTGNDEGVEDYLAKSYGSEYYDIYDYGVYHFGLFKVIKVYKDVDVKLPKYFGPAGGRFANCYAYCRELSYNKNQPNPNLIKSKGGSCLAFALLFKALCEKNNIECGLVLKDNHAYNYVIVDGIKHDVDVVNDKIGGLE